MTRSATALLIAVVSAFGCASNPSSRTGVDTYDFGLPASRASGDSDAFARIALEVVSPPWFDALNIDYRLAYDDPLKQREYAASRWAGAPGVLLGQRLRQRLGFAATPDAASDCLLRFELQEFSQVFQTPQQSQGVLLGSASLIDGKRQRLAEHVFLIEKPAAHPNARGGVEALVGAVGELTEQLAAWLGETQKRDSGGHCRP